MYIHSELYALIIIWYKRNDINSCCTFMIKDEFLKTRESFVENSGLLMATIGKFIY